MARRARRLTGAVRRPVVTPRTGAAALVLATVLATVTTGCGGVGQPASYGPTGIDGLVIPTPSPDPADFVAEVDNPWLGVGSGESWRYVVADGGARVGAVRVDVLPRTRVAGLEATAVRTVTRLAGEEPETVTRYYAQDDAGNVWLLGADAGDVGWRAGERGAEAGLAMPAEPRVGDGWRRAVVPGVGTETLLVDELDPAADVLWMIAEGADARTRDVYESGVGLVESVEVDGDRTLTLVR